MSSKKIAEFPNVEAKLQKPSKQSAFEKQRAEAEAKRAREAAETAAVLKEFQASFDDDDHSPVGGSRFSSSQGLAPRGQGSGSASIGGPGRRHFGTSNLKSGPGSLGPVSGPRSGPGSLGPAPGSYSKKRGFDSYRQDQDRDGRLRGDARDTFSVSKAFNQSDDEDEGHIDRRTDEAAVARPTLRLSNVPPGISPSAIKSLMPENLVVEDVKIIPASGPSTERRSVIAVVTLSQETPATDMDSAVSALQHRYLGYGFYLSLHRHLSSAVASSMSAASLGTSSAGSHPFGAKPVSQDPKLGKPPPQHLPHRGFAPPTSYGPSVGGPVNRANLLHVPVKPPVDVKMLQLINRTIESMLEHGPDFEALLMTRAEVQQEEKWAWIWDARSEGGIWYRWRLWEIVTGADSGGKKGRFLPLFDGSHAWKAPEKRLAWEYTTSIDDFVSDSEYNSSEDEDEEEEAARDQKPGQEAEVTFLNPLDKAKLTHLLSRLPTTLSKIRKGDIARVTTFALTHASRGADEIVDMIVSNIDKPFASSAANPEFRPSRSKGKASEGPESREAEGEDKGEKEGQDNSGASLVGLYVVSDILSSSSTSGIRHAWRFRQIFEGALREQKTFEVLGLAAERLNWGRLKAEKWKRSVGMILNLWEGWCVFPAEAQELFANTFENPPSAKADEEHNEAANKGRWKPVEASTPTSLPLVPESEAGVEGEPMEEDDAVGVPMEDSDVEGEPMEDSDVEGEPMAEDDVEGEPMEDDDGDNSQSPGANIEAASAAAVDGNVEPASDPAATHTAGAGQMSSKPAGQARKRMRAVDMFADSGESDGGN